MDKERKTIELNSTILFNRDVKASELDAVIPKGFQGDIIINGELEIEDNFYIQCDNLYVLKATTRDGVNMKGPLSYIEGNFHSIETIYCNDLKINGSLYCDGKVDSMNILVSQDFVAKTLEPNSSKVIIGGDFICDNVESMESITVYGKTQTKCVIMAEDIDLRGPIEAAGITNSIV